MAVHFAPDCDCVIALAAAGRHTFETSTILLYVDPDGVTDMNEYTVRYQLGGEELTVSLAAENAASAARIVEDQHIEEDERFELIEVHMVESSDTDLDTPPLQHVN